MGNIFKYVSINSPKWFCIRSSRVRLVFGQSNGDLASYLLFGTFLVWAVLLVINTKKRGQTFPDETSEVGDLIAIGAGIALWAAITFWLHEWLIGIPAIA